MRFWQRTGRPRRRSRPRSPPPPRYKQVEARRQSFLGVDWPLHLDATPDKLVKAGFYYIGPDRVKCGYCGGRLKNWQPRDSAIEEHLKHFPNCEFVQNIEKQTAVLSKNIRTETKGLNCVSSEELMRQHAEERAKSNAKEQWRKTVKVRYNRSVIKKAENRLKRKNSTLNTILEEIHATEKQEYMGTNQELNTEVPHAKSSDESLRSADEDKENIEPLDMEETVKKLQNELQMVEDEHDDLQSLMKNWQPRDSAIEEHLKHSPNCEFVQNIKKQTAVLSKNIRSKKKESTCVSSGELMRQHAKERAKSKDKELWRKTLKKMCYGRSVIKKAEKRLKQKNSTLSLNTVLEEIHVIEKEEYMGTNQESNTEIPDAESSDESLSSGDEDKENIEPLDAEEKVKKLQNELKMVEDERDDLQNLMLCKVCLVNRIDTLFLTCRHFSTCHECADRVRECPTCIQVILGTVDVFMD